MRKAKDLSQSSQRKGEGKSEKDEAVNRRDAEGAEKGGRDPSLHSG
jgi:hypothetical protein